jgi:anti-sigma regulatory factor (Ser/Thr protein kinase)
MTTSFGDTYAGPGARHEAFLYTSADEFASMTASFVAEGLEKDESAMVVTSAEKLEAFRTVLDDSSPLVFLAEGDDWYRNPAETVGRWLGFVEGQVARGRPRVRGVGEIVPLRRGDSVEQWMDYESILNPLLTAVPLSLLCAYNTDVLPDRIIEDARASHPTVHERGSASASVSYLPPGRSAARSLAFDGRRSPHRPVDVATTCEYVEAEARRAGIADRALQRLLVAVGEVARNAFVHGNAPVSVTAWADRESFTCQIEDGGEGIADLVAGYWPPAKGNAGWGLWLARQSTDSLDVGRGPHGNAVRLTLRRSSEEAPHGALATRL